MANLAAINRVRTGRRLVNLGYLAVTQGSLITTSVFVFRWTPVALLVGLGCIMLFFVNLVLFQSYAFRTAIQRLFFLSIDCPYCQNRIPFRQSYQCPQCLWVSYRHLFSPCEECRRLGRESYVSYVNCPTCGHSLNI